MRYEFIFYSFYALVHKITVLTLSLENNSYILASPCNILYIRKILIKDIQELEANLSLER